MRDGKDLILVYVNANTLGSYIDIFDNSINYKREKF
jgi:hypothetical protein